MNGCRGLWVTQFVEGGSDGNIFLSVHECGANFIFISGRHDVAHYLGDSVDGSVELDNGRSGLLR